jgi:hypothetical protein
MANPEDKTLLQSDDGTPPPDQYIPIPDAHYAAMGKVADAWADLEFEIDSLIWELLQTPQALGACVTAQMVSVHPRMSALVSLVTLWELNDERTTELKRFHGKLGILADKRNRLIHDKRMIMWKTKGVVRFEISARNKLKFEPVPEDIDYLTNFAREVSGMQLSFIEIRNSVLTELQASRGKRRGPFPHITQTQAQKPAPPIDKK